MLEVKHSRISDYRAELIGFIDDLDDLKKVADVLGKEVHSSVEARPHDPTAEPVRGYYVLATLEGSLSAVVSFGFGSYVSIYCCTDLPGLRAVPDPGSPAEAHGEDEVLRVHRERKARRRNS